MVARSRSSILAWMTRAVWCRLIQVVTWSRFAARTFTVTSLTLSGIG